MSSALVERTSTRGEPFDLAHENSRLEKASPGERIQWGLEHFPDQIALSSSFGAQAAVMLHLTTTLAPELPVIFIDTGYHFPETYQFVDSLSERLKLNLRIYRASYSPAWQESRHGKLWEQGLEGIERYNQINKVEPMNRALDELGAKAWLVGLRRQQADSRKKLNVLATQSGRIKIHPIIEWTDRDVFNYLKKYDLPYHPLWDQGYVSIGDVHTTKKLGEGMTEADTRFFGLKRECGLHEGAVSEYAI